MSALIYVSFLMLRPNDTLDSKNIWGALRFGPTIYSICYLFKIEKF